MNVLQRLLFPVATLLVTSVSSAAAGVPYFFDSLLSNGITIDGTVTVETSDPGFVAGGTVEFVTGGVTSFHFIASDGVISEEINSALIANPTPQTIRLTFSSSNFPQVEAWDFSFSNEWTGGNLVQAITVHSPSNPGYEQWAGHLLDGSRFPSNGSWTTDVVSPEGAPYFFDSVLSNGITIDGTVTVDTSDPGFVPGGTVEFVSGGVTSFHFIASNGVISEEINSTLIANPTPQTIRLTFSSSNFPQVEAWDFSFSNEWTGGNLVQAVTVQSPSNTGYEQWAGHLLSGSQFPSNGSWTTDVVSTEATTWSRVKALFR